ncbi:hypothetical protein [Ectobacillus ponti]|uniref:Uncharacterized protein n=1 Tax=Ectobacillus ponti TaxID=2961894 RepID=A0AA41X8F5_9BACI|nr:hypothetical protein [Ectobacillus ponti]MCP8970697.1 hypothetical protein [Ectobacillus ponti]
MNVEQAKQVLERLAEGIDPLTGEEFAVGSPYQRADVIRALQVAVKGCEKLEQAERRKRQLPRLAGRAWTEAEEQEIARHFDEGTALSDIARMHERTPRAIQLRLLKMGRIAW